MRSLSTRLVVTAVALVAVVTTLVSAATVLAMRAYLTDQLDSRVLAAARSLSGPGGPDGPPGNQEPNMLIAAGPDRGDDRQGVILGAGREGNQMLTEAQLDVVLDVGSGEHTVRVQGAGGYRVLMVGDGDSRLVVGLPTDDLDESVARLVTLAAILTLTGIAVAAAAGLVVVHRQLAPLRSVATTARRVSELPLSIGEIELGDRVPVALTDERTEVGRVGAALNSLLDHVETSLAARHRSEQQVRQFVADASHELRTPLTTIKGYAELARRRPEDAAAVLAALDKVEAESGRMTSLVEDLLLLARLDAGRPLEREPVDLTRLLVEAVSDARVLAPGHRWRLDLPEDALEVVGDEQRLHQLVTNLLANARKHTTAGTTVTVTARPGVVAVHDDGPGFPPELVGTAFERFARADVARTRTSGDDGGAGLGLALVNAIATAHGGGVSLSSRPGDTTVTVRLPH